MKKTISLILLSSALILVSNIALAATPSNLPANRPAPTVVKYTAEQQTCIDNARKTQQAAMQAAQATLNAATTDALTTKQAAIKDAQDTFNAAVSSATDKRQAAMEAAQKVSDIKARMADIKAAMDAYNNNSAVKSAKIPYDAAVKAANDAYNNDATVKQAMPAYKAAVKAARATDIIKQCTGTSSKKSFWSSLGSLFQKAGSSLISAFTFVK